MKNNPAALGLALAAFWTIPCLAGPCKQQIHDVEIRIDTKLNHQAARGPAATEGTFATLDHQPTPASIAAAETALGDVSAETVAKVKKAMRRAYKADLAGNENRCKRALADAEKALNQ
jgi:hypothetical protein